jgi:hypothetical protein
MKFLRFSPTDLTHTKSVTSQVSYSPTNYDNTTSVVVENGVVEK